VGGHRLPHSPPRGGRSIALASPSPGWEGLGEGEVFALTKRFYFFHNCKFSRICICQPHHRALHLDSRSY